MCLPVSLLSSLYLVISHVSVSVERVVAPIGFTFTKMPLMTDDMTDDISALTTSALT